jgi:hypothetical protein
MINEETVRALIREMIRQELEENSSTGSAGGAFMTPKAFKKTDGTDTEDDQGLLEARSHYLDYKNKGSASSIQRIGKSIAEINRSLTEVERAITMASRLKTETNTANDQLWKRSLKHLMKIEGRILKMAHALRELKQ